MNLGFCVLLPSPFSALHRLCARSLCCSFAAHTDILVPLPHFLAPVATFRARAGTGM